MIYWLNEVINENYIGLNVFLVWMVVVVEVVFVLGSGFFFFRLGRFFFLSSIIGLGSLFLLFLILIFVLLKCSLLGDFLNFFFKVGFCVFVSGFVLFVVFMS